MASPMAGRPRVAIRSSTILEDVAFRVNVCGCNDNRCFWVLRNDDTFDDFSGRSA
ncbi:MULTISPECIES: DUF3223 domain-containing protein [Streptomyces]|uniref:DUF3223 domain-containing protein n=1 Tax=Streptomyces doebereineriae TaxID=3075528 RepID=A0ABU2V288_9ACTN|nr:DUF3223 domain-containing protein [Streptomyces sp. DSM 41640]MDT0479334.1 DUF3223 domain-containing protein [Streptomyces sp. DSM 41640]